ncbi:hypothetical protein [Arthrobacter echini]|uniref:hypothetical protein n=1 Tax=Arthrobacter echini TaxID=1529066 RepID=UPI0014561893|nr:hypothetical protein [Arthrobacter echini]
MARRRAFVLLRVAMTVSFVGVAARFYRIMPRCGAGLRRMTVAVRIGLFLQPVLAVRAV